MACAANADQIDAIIQITVDGSQVPDGAAGAGGRCMQCKSYSRETKLEVVSFHRKNGKNLYKSLAKEQEQNRGQQKKTDV